MIDNEIKLIAESEEYYFSELEEAFCEFERYELTSAEVDKLIEDLNQFYSTEEGGNKFSRFIEEHSASEEILTLIAKIVSMIDMNADKKSELNPYDDDRVIAKAG